MKRKTFLISLALAVAATFMGCATNVGSEKCSKTSQNKLTKDMFYKNGKFDEEAAKQAYFDMMTKLGYPISENLRKNMWVCDFGLGDFPSVGMAVPRGQVVLLRRRGRRRVEISRRKSSREPEEVRHGAQGMRCRREGGQYSATQPQAGIPLPDCGPRRRGSNGIRRAPPKRRQPLHKSRRKVLT